MEQYFITLQTFTLEEYEVWKQLNKYCNFETGVSGYTVNQLVVNSDKRYMIPMLSYLGDLHLKNGSESILNRTVIFCYALYEICNAEHKTASEVLKVIYTYDLAETKENWWTRFKHKIGYYKHPYKLSVNSDGLMLVALISGKNLNDAFEYMLLSYNLE